MSWYVSHACPERVDLGPADAAPGRRARRGDRCLRPCEQPVAGRAGVGAVRQRVRARIGGPPQRCRLVERGAQAFVPGESGTRVVGAGESQIRLRHPATERAGQQERDDLPGQRIRHDAAEPATNVGAAVAGRTPAAQPFLVDPACGALVGPGASRRCRSSAVFGSRSIGGRPCDRGGDHKDYRSGTRLVSCHGSAISLPYRGPILDRAVRRC